MYFLNKVSKLIKKQTDWNTLGIWEDAVSNEADPLPKDKTTIIYTWKNSGELMVDKLKKLTRKNFRIVRNDCWYLDNQKSTGFGSEQWFTFGKCILGDKNITTNVYANDFSEVAPNMTIGGEISLWTEYIDFSNYEQKLWIRGSSGANVLWHGDDSSGYLKMKARLHNFRCWLLKNGVKAEPVGPGGFCKNGEDLKYDDEQVEIVFSDEKLTIVCLLILFYIGPRFMKLVYTVLTLLLNECQTSIIK